MSEVNEWYFKDGYPYYSVSNACGRNWSKYQSAVGKLFQIHWENLGYKEYSNNKERYENRKVYFSQ